MLFPLFYIFLNLPVLSSRKSITKPSSKKDTLSSFLQGRKAQSHVLNFYGQVQTVCHPHIPQNKTSSLHPSPASFPYSGSIPAPFFLVSRPKLKMLILSNCDKKLAQMSLTFLWYPFSNQFWMSGTLAGEPSHWWVRSSFSQTKPHTASGLFGKWSPFKSLWHYYTEENFCIQD